MSYHEKKLLNSHIINKTIEKLALKIKMLEINSYVLHLMRNYEFIFPYISLRRLLHRILGFQQKPTLLLPNSHR